MLPWEQSRDQSSQSCSQCPAECAELSLTQRNPRGLLELWPGPSWWQDRPSWEGEEWHGAGGTIIVCGQEGKDKPPEFTFPWS